MKFLKLLLFSIAINIIFSNFFSKSNAEINTNLIINMFCIESVKSEMNTAKLVYKESFGQEVCKCYLKKVSNNISHEDAISECKLESKEFL